MAMPDALTLDSSVDSDTDRAAALEERRSKRASRAPAVLLSKAVANYRGWYLPLMFAVLVIHPPIIEFLSGRDVTSFDQAFFDQVSLGRVSIWAGRAMTLIILSMALLSIVAWFTSKRRGQTQRLRRSKRRSRSGARVPDSTEEAVAASPQNMDPALPTGARPTAMPIDTMNSEGIAITEQSPPPTTRADKRNERIRMRMLATSHASRLPATTLAPRGWTHGGRSKRSSRREVTRTGLRRQPLPIHWLLAAALVFHLVCSVIPNFIGLDPALPAQVLYAFPVMVAIYAGRRLPHRRVLSAVQWSIAIVMVAGLVVAAVKPQMAMSPAGLEQRVPFLDTRFWGLGSGPNAIAPLAILQLMLQVHQRRRYSPLWVLANAIAAAAAVIALVWSQSLTAWAAAFVVLPLLLLRRTLDNDMGGTRFKPHHVVGVMILLIFGFGFIGSELISTGAISALADMLPGQKSSIWKEDSIDTATAIGDQMMTGRGAVWAVALDVWRDNPWFGFGAHAWDADFRLYYGLFTGVHAHNQWLQALSVSGLVGFVALFAHMVVLGRCAWRTSGVSRGLTIGLFTVLLVRMVSEVPLETRSLATSDAVAHLTLIFAICAYAARIPMAVGRRSN
jgi:O-antigen ligase